MVKAASMARMNPILLSSASMAAASVALQPARGQHQPAAVLQPLHCLDPTEICFACELRLGPARRRPPGLLRSPRGSAPRLAGPRRLISDRTCRPPRPPLPLPAPSCRCLLRCCLLLPQSPALERAIEWLQCLWQHSAGRPWQLHTPRRQFCALEAYFTQRSRGW